MAWLHEEHSSPRINWAQTFGRGKKKNWVPPKKWHPSRPKKKVQFCRGSMELIWKIWSSSLFYFPCWLFFFRFWIDPSTWTLEDSLPKNLSVSKLSPQTVPMSCGKNWNETTRIYTSYIYIYTHLRWFCHPFVKVIILKFKVQVLSFYEHLPTTIDFHTLGHFFWFSKCFFLLIFRICGGIKLQPSGNKGRNSCCDRVGFPLVLLIQCEERRLGGCFKNFLFSPLPGEMIQID